MKAYKAVVLHNEVWYAVDGNYYTIVNGSSATILPTESPFRWIIYIEGRVYELDEFSPDKWLSVFQVTGIFNYKLIDLVLGQSEVEDD